MAEPPNTNKAWAIIGLDKLPDGLYRLISTDQSNDTLIIRRLREREPQEGRREDFGLHSIGYSSLREAERKGNAAPVELLGARLGDFDIERLSPARDAIRKQRGPMLADMLQPVTFAHLMDKEARPPELRLLAVKHSFTERQARSLFDRLLEHGLDAHATALTGHDRSGKKPNAEYRKIQGRPSKLDRRGVSRPRAARNCNRKDRELLGVFVKSGKFDPKASWAHNRREYHSHFALDGVQLLSGGRCVRKSKPEAEWLTASQFRYQTTKVLQELASSFNPKVLQLLRLKGKKTPSTGSARDNIHFPGQRLMVDSTVADVFVVADWDRTKILGRPVVYVVVDASTSLILGLHVTLYPASLRQAKIALFFALTSKKQLLARFGLEGYAHLFPQAPVPAELVFDRGELHSKGGRALVDALWVRELVPPPFAAAWKGIVERHFRTLNEGAIHWMAGSTQGRHRERGEPDVRLDAALTLHEFTRLILLEVLAWNTCGSPDIRIRPEFLKTGAAPSLVNLWHWGLTNLHGSPRYMRSDEAALALLEGNTCSVGERGICLNNRRWVGEWMKDEHLLLTGLVEKDVQLFPDPIDPTQGFALIEGQDVLRTVSIDSSIPTEVTWTAEDLEEYEACCDTTWTVHAGESEAFVTSVHATQRELLNTAKTRARQANKQRPQSKAARTRSIRENRIEALNKIPEPPLENQESESKSPFDDLMLAAAGADFVGAVLDSEVGQ